MIGENWQLDPNELVEFESKRLKFKTAGKLAIISENL